jgi:lysyl-tRNA synthetase, class I
VRGELPPGFEAVFRYSLLDPNADVDAAAASFRFPFAHLATLIQIPGVDVASIAAAEKGAPLEPAEAASLETRIAAARAWLDAYAPDDARLTVQPELPDDATRLDDLERHFLGALLERANELKTSPKAHDGDAWQAAIFETATEGGLKPGKAFRAVYLAFLGRPNGPRAGWLLAKLEPEFVVERLREAAAGAKLRV